MKKVLVLLLSFVFVFGYSQPPFSLNTKTEIGIASSMVLGGVSLYTINKQKTELTEENIQALNPSVIPAFEKNTINNYNTHIIERSDYFVMSSVLLAAGFQGLAALNYTQNSHDFWLQSGTLSLMFFEANVLNLIGTEIAKNSVQRTRPFVYNSDVPLDVKLDPDANKSFFSGHTSVTATNSFLAAYVLSSYYPKSWISYSSWAVGATLPVVAAYMRVKGGKHFPTDVITGYAFGAFCGVLVPYLHSNKKNQDISVSMAPYVVSLKFSL